MELLQQLSPDEMDAVYIPVGGGGLIAGCASVLKAFAPHVRIVGCQPQASNVMQQSVAAGRVVQAPSEDTLSDGTAGGVFLLLMTAGMQNDLSVEAVCGGCAGIAERAQWQLRGFVR